MTVKECVITAATELGIADEVQEYFDGGSVDGQKNAQLLLTCFNLVENELALDYLPLYAEDEMSSETGKIDFSALSMPAVRILRVSDEWGNSVPFQIFPAYLKTQPGKVRVAYTYTPEEKSLDGESDFKLQASVRLMAYGIAAEYTLATGLFEEYAVWDKKYKEAIDAAYKALPCKRMRSRRWA